jgi:translation initiation factor IF-2
MRARGAQVTDIAIIVIAADDDIMPQTKEAISHAQAAGVPIIFAINKIDKPNSNPEKIKEKLAGMNLLVEDWGGKFQSHDISAKVGTGVKELLEKVLLEAEVLDLKSNPNKEAQGTVVEAFLDKGKGYVSTILVQHGTLKIGDYMLAGKHHGKIKAMHDERGNTVMIAGPSTPVSVLGLDGAATAGDKFNIFDDEKEAKAIASKRSQLMREQSVRTQRHITLDEIGRRIALGQFKELNVILKGDVDGSVEALSDSFSKLSSEQIQINIIHKGVGAITETDVMLASASDAIIIGFNVRPAGNARQLADKEEIDIRYYSIIYAAIDDLKDAMEGMLAPEMKEEILGTAEIREIFKISKVGSIAGCMVMDGKIARNAKVRIIRDGVVVHAGELSALKRFKDDVKDVAKGYDCGIQIKGYNDIEERDVIEAYHEVAIKKKLK